MRSALIAAFDQQLLYPALAVGLGLVVVCLLWALFARGSKYPYQAAAPLLSASERAFYLILSDAIGRDFALFTKVRLADIIQVQGGLSGKKRSAAFNRIKSKHADFVACDTKTFQVICVIELDDRSHRQAERQLRDAFVDAALGAAGLPILHVPVQRAYSTDAVRQQVFAAIGQGRRRASV